MMKRTIFYSWQSDLPNNTNRGFIEDCIKKSINDVAKFIPFNLELTLDKDTFNEPGNPEIVNTILSKIENAKIFIADISIINSDSKLRKTPNPNVLFELGYASKALGWERIICIYNLDYGSFDELPFDLKHRKPIAYTLNNKTKSEAKNGIANAIIKTITSLQDRGLLFDEMEDFLKKNVDTEILTIINHLSKVLFGIQDKPNLLIHTGKLLNLKRNELFNILKNKPILGFHIFKTFEENYKSLRKIYENTISSPHYKREIIVIILKLLDWLAWYNKIMQERIYPSMFIISNVIVNRKLKIIGSNNKDLPNRLILGECIEDDKYRVVDFGDIIQKNRLQNALVNFQISDDKHLEVYINVLESFIENVNLWLDKTNGEFIVDTFNNFEMK